MLRWLLIAGLAMYGAWVSYLFVQQGNKPPPRQLVSEAQRVPDCPKLHCECQKGEIPAEVPDGDDPPAQDGNGS